MYGLNDNGILLAETQRDMTPIQRFVYALAKEHHTEDYNSKPSGMRHAHSATHGI